MKKWWVVLAVVLLLSAFIAAVDLDLFFGLLSLGSLLLMVLSVLAMVVTFRRAKRVSPFSLGISMSVSLLCLVIYGKLLGVDLEGIAVLIGLLGGALVGSGWGLTKRLIVEGGAVRMKGNAWYLAVWGTIFALNQAVTILTGRPPRVAILMLLFATGMVIGDGTTILIRSRQLRASLPAGESP